MYYLYTQDHGMKEKKMFHINHDINYNIIQVSFRFLFIKGHNPRRFHFIWNTA